jgi:hypothetical protein
MRIVTSATAPHNTGQRSRRVEWPLERVLFALAGSMTLLSVGLSALVSPWFLLLAALVGVNQWLFVLLGACPASIVLRRVFSLPSVLYPAPERPDGPRRQDGSCAAPAQPSSRHATAAPRR